MKRHRLYLNRGFGLKPRASAFIKYYVKKYRVMMTTERSNRFNQDTIFSKYVGLLKSVNRMGNQTKLDSFIVGSAAFC